MKSKLQILGRVVFAPLASREEAPLERILETVVVLAAASPGDLGPGVALICARSSTSARP